jgi:glutathione S-transferase
MPIPQLYSQAFNPFTEKVACALAHKGVEYRRIEVSDSDEIKRLSPEKQTLPVLEVSGKRVSGSGEIVLWLEELYTEPSLFAKEPQIRRKQESLADWSDESFAFYWNQWRVAREEYERKRVQATPGLLSRIHQHVEERMGIESELASEVIPGTEIIAEKLGTRMDDLVGFLGARPYFYADQLSVADIAVFGMSLVMRDGPINGSATMLAERPTLVAHLDRMSKLNQRGVKAGE